jgi:UDP-N-acetylglucosamine:LPS N-acetylglucosamine transferase
MTRALIVSGSIGSGHDTVASACRWSLEANGAVTATVDAMALLGERRARTGEWVFRRMMAMGPVYDAFHFSQLRDGGELAERAERAAVANMLPRWTEVLESFRPDLIVSVYATGAAAASLQKQQDPNVGTVVVMTDSFAHRLWVHEHTDLFVVTSELAAASVRRFRSSAAVAVVPGPVRRAFHDAPQRDAARRDLGLDCARPTALVMGGGWGIGPVEEATRRLAAAEFQVLAVAGTDKRLYRRLQRLAGPTVRAFGWTDAIPQLMAAADVVVTTSGDTCREARVVGRPLVILDAVPGHGRENLMHELELGSAAVAGVETLVGNVRSMVGADVVPDAGDWDKAFHAALVEHALVRELRLEG